MVKNRNRLALSLIAASALLWCFSEGRTDRGLLAQNATKPAAKAAEKTTKPAAPAKAAEPKAADAEPDPRAADRAAIRKTMQSFAEAFQKSDAPAAAAFMSAGAELISVEGVAVRGREAIQQAYVNHFAKTARPKISLQVTSLEFPSRDTAMEEGLMTISKGGADADDSATNHYNILYVREDGKWYLASVRESAAEKSPLQELEWLIGTWAAKGKESEAQTTYEWFGNKAFIRAQFSIREKDSTVTGMQLIGLDPETNSLRTWTFEVDGGFGEGTCTRDGNKWVFETTTSMTDRRIMAASNILIHVDKNTFTWQPVNLTIDGESIANLPPVKVVRVETKK